jgi:hypothetical protein
LAESFYYQARITRLWNGSKEEKEISEERRLYGVGIGCERVRALEVDTAKIRKDSSILRNA